RRVEALGELRLRLAGDGEGGEIDAERRGQNLVSAHGGATGDSARPPDDLIAEPEPAFPHPETGLRSAHDIPRAVERTGGRVRRGRSRQGQPGRCRLQLDEG